MRQLKSWKWKNLFSIVGWQKVNVIECVLKVMLLCLTFSFWNESSFLKESSNDELLFDVVSWVIIFICLHLIFEDLVLICCADKVYKIKYKDMQAYCFIYRLSKKRTPAVYELVIYDKGTTYYTSNVVDFFTTYADGKRQNVIFKKQGSRSWFTITCNGVEELGQKVQANVFLKPGSENPTLLAKLCVLTSTGYQTLHADYFVSHDNLYIPDGALYSVHPKERNLFECYEYCKERPDNFLMVKTKSKYHFFGIYHKNRENKEVYFEEVVVNTAFFREGLDTIVLVYDDDDYVVLHRKKGTSVHLNTDLIVEMTDNEKNEGRLYGLIGNKLHSVYEGRFYSIDFHKHYVVGDDFYFHS